MAGLGEGGLSLISVACPSKASNTSKTSNLSNLARYFSVVANLPAKLHAALPANLHADSTEVLDLCNSFGNDCLWRSMRA
jgi:hypothetical protein